MVNKYATCLKCKGLPNYVTTTPDLSVKRLSDDPSLTHIGNNFAGPLYVKDKSSNQLYAYLRVAQLEHL